MKITKYGHACLLLERGETKLLIDPGAFSKGFENETGIHAILITHQHSDHLVPDNLKMITKHNPDVKIFADEESAAKLKDEAELDVTAVHQGDTFSVGPIKVEVIGTHHAVIHPNMGAITNVGYLVGGSFYYPGDNFILPQRDIKVLALPIGAPWSKISEIVDYLVAVRPEVAVPVHDAVLAMPDMHVGMARAFADKVGTKITVIENGTSAQF